MLEKSWFTLCCYELTFVVVLILSPITFRVFFSFCYLPDEAAQRWRYRRAGDLAGNIQRLNSPMGLNPHKRGAQPHRVRLHAGLGGRPSESTAMVGLLGECCRFCASASPHQLHLIADGDFPAFNHEAVERQLAVKATVDAASDFLILDQGVRVV